MCGLFLFCGLEKSNWGKEDRHLSAEDHLLFMGWVGRITWEAY